MLTHLSLFADACRSSVSPYKALLTRRVSAACLCSFFTRFALVVEYPSVDGRLKQHRSTWFRDRVTYENTVVNC